MRLFGKKVEALILDVDGVIINWWDSAVDRFERLARECGLPPESVAPYMACVSDGSGRFKPSLDGGLREMWPGLSDAQYAYLVKRFREIEWELGFEPFDGAVEAMEWMRGYGLRLGICTTNNRQALYMRMKCVPFRFKNFRYVHYGDRRPFKPEPGALKKTAERLGLSVDECAYVGDWQTDYQMAVGAGMRFIAVTSPAITTAHFKEMGVPEDRIVPSLSHVVNLFTP